MAQRLSAVCWGHTANSWDDHGKARIFLNLVFCHLCGCKLKSMSFLSSVMLKPLSYFNSTDDFMVDILNISFFLLEYLFNVQVRSTCMFLGK